MKTPEERAVRLLRRQWTPVPPDRRSFSVQSLALGIAFRDASRAFWGAFHVHPKQLNWSWHLKWLDRLGAAYIIAVVVLFVALLIQYGPPWLWPK